MGSTLCGAWSAETTATAISQNFEIDFNDLPHFDETAFNAELAGKTDAPEMLREAWKKMIAEGKIASTTMVAARIKENRIEWRKVGDTGLMVVRPSDQVKTEAEAIEAHLEAPDKNPPTQIFWDKEKDAWEIINGSEEKGTIQAKKGDLLLIFSDGLLKGGEFAGKSREEIIDLLKTETDRIANFTVRKTDLPQIVADNILELAEGNKPLDDIFIGVAII